MPERKVLKVCTGRKNILVCSKNSFEEPHYVSYKVTTTTFILAFLPHKHIMVIS